MKLKLIFVCVNIIYQSYEIVFNSTTIFIWKKKKKQILFTWLSQSSEPYLNQLKLIQDIQNPFSRKDYDFSLIDSKYMLSLCIYV